MILHPEISIIIQGNTPCFIESILLQPFADFELILWGAPSEVHAKYADRDPRVRIIQAKSKAQAKRHASGRYLCFPLETEGWHSQALLQVYETSVREFPLGVISLTMGKTQLRFIPSQKLKTITKNLCLKLLKTLIALKRNLTKCFK